MATFSISGNGTATGVALSAAPTSVQVYGTFDGATVALQASHNGINFSPVVVDISKGVRYALVSEAQCMAISLPSGWEVRTVTTGAGAATSLTVVVE